MKLILTLLTPLVLVMPAGLHGAEASKAPSKPNILFILADDLGWGDPSCYPKDSAVPDAFVATPHIDALAASGVRCTDGYAGHVVCAPSRAALMAGRYQHRFGYFGFAETNAPFPKDIRTMPESLRAAGYATGMFGKWHVSFARGSGPLDRGFDRFFGFLGGEHFYFDANIGQPIHHVGNAPDAWIFDQREPVKSVKYLTDEFTDRALSFMQGATAAGKPFFVYLPYNTPHAPLQVPWEDLEPFARQRPGDKFVARDIARAMIVRLDANVGRLMAFLKDNGLEKDTLVVFSSDNGGAQQCHNGGLRAPKGYFYEGGIRVPFIFNWPRRLPAGREFHEPLIQLDLYPTFLAAAGVAPADFPPGLDGVDLLPFLDGSRNGPVHERLFWGQSEKKGKWAVREGHWKLVHEDTNPPDQAKSAKLPKNMKIQLYNLAADPFERNDLAEAQPQRVARLRKLMDEFLAAAAPSLYTRQIDAAHRAELADRQKDPALKPVKRWDGSPGHHQGGNNLTTGTPDKNAVNPKRLHREETP